MAEKTITIRVPDDFYKEIKIHVAQKDVTLKDYVLELIRKDLDAQKK